MTKVTIRSLLVLCFLVFAGFASAEDTEYPVIVPPEMCGRYFMVPIYFEKRGNENPDDVMLLLYDTGASHTVIDPDAIERVSGQNVKDKRRVNLIDLRSGPLKISKFNVRVVELDHLETALGSKFDGILGYSFFRKYLLTLDYANEEMRLDIGKLPKPDGKTIFSAKGKDKRPWITMQLGDEKVKLLIDSGSNGTMSLRDLGDYPSFAPPTPVSISQRFDHLDYNKGIRSKGDLTFGDHRVATPIVRSVPKTQLLGNQIMQNYLFTFDQKKKRVRIIRNPDVDDSTPVSLPSSYSDGLLTAPHREGLEVKSILDDSPASRSDIKVGDIVLEVDSKPALRKGCRPKIPSREPRHYRIRRGDATFERTLEQTVVVE